MRRNQVGYAKSPDFHAVLTMVPDRAHHVLRREFSAFFTHMITPEPGWPVIPPQAFVDALADSLVAVGVSSGKGFSTLETLVVELQDRLTRIKDGAVFWPDGSTRIGMPAHDKHATVYAGDACWLSESGSQQGRVTRLCFNEQGIIFEGNGTVSDGSKFQFQGRLFGTDNHYVGEAQCRLRETGEEWTADVTLHHTSCANELEGTWSEPSPWSFSLELARLYK